MILEWLVIFISRNQFFFFFFFLVQCSITNTKENKTKFPYLKTPFKQQHHHIVDMWKPTKETSFKSKILSFYGNNLETFNFLMKSRDNWIDRVLTVSEHIMKKQADQAKKFPLISNDQLNLQDLTLEPETDEYMKEIFKQDIVLKVEGNNTSADVTLSSGKPIELKSHTNRNALAVATGGQITSMQWLPREGESEVSYLAVSLFNSPDGACALDPELSMFNKSKNRTKSSAIQIWKYDFAKNELVLENVLVVSALGVGNFLKWAPINTEEGVLGVLMGVFTDGCVHAFKITDSLPKYSTVKQSSLEYSIKDGKRETKITTFDFVGSEKMLLATSDGSIAEYMLPFNYNGTDLNIPNFKTVVSWSAIQYLLCTDDHSGNKLCLVYTAAHRCMSFVYNNSLQDVYAMIPRSHIQPSYNFPMQNLVIANHPDQSQLSSPRINHYTGSSVARTDFYFTTCKVSEVLGHPFLLSGGANGEITIHNYLRKFLSSKTTAAKAMPIRLWKFDARSEGKLVLISDVFIESQESPIPAEATRLEGCVTSLAWNENVVGSSAFAAGIAGGVLLIERLDPKYL